MAKPKTVDEYIAQSTPMARPMLRQVRRVIRSSAPKAIEKISYGIPFYEYTYPGYKGRMMYFAGFANHVGLYVIPQKVSAALAKQMKPYRSGRSTLRFPVGTKIPTTMIKQLVKLRMKEIDQIP